MSERIVARASRLCGSGVVNETHGRDARATTDLNPAIRGRLGCEEILTTDEHGLTRMSERIVARASRLS
jgi:hypothetical protein